MYEHGAESSPQSKLTSIDTVNYGHPPYPLNDGEQHRIFHREHVKRPIVTIGYNQNATNTTATPNTTSTLLAL